MQVRAHTDLPVDTRSSVAISDNWRGKTLLLATNSSHSDFASSLAGDQLCFPAFSERRAAHFEHTCNPHLRLCSCRCIGRPCEQSAQVFMACLLPSYAPRLGVV